MLGFLAILVACRGCGEPPPPPAFDPADHYGGVFSARDAVIGGEVGALAEAGRAIDATLPEELPAQAQLAVDRMHGAAGFLVVAEDLEEGADAVVELGRACGECHRAMGRAFEASRLVDGLAAPGSHAEAADQAWAALVAGDDAALHAALARFDAALGPAQDPLAPRAEEPPADAYAGVLTRCAPCHAERGVTLKRTPGSP